MSITIGSYSGLPDPSSEDIEFFIRGTSYSLTNGVINHDNIDTTQKQRISLSWQAVSLTNRNNIIAAALSTLTANRSYTDIRSNTITVTNPTDRSKPKSVSVPGASLRYNVSITLEEV